MKKLLTALSATLLAAAAFAQAALPAVEGEVRKIDTETKKITLKHGDIPNLEMTGMTMVFRVKDPELLGKVKPGDKVRFTADKVDGALTVLSIEPEPAS
ncbi:Cu/Ag efflux protein CusF [Variovorax boronicumulans]|uniref:Cu/Ag efflux protein CusF n=1 Tax=Variovorax boronicumulans TaxID=436515 RepID=A0AAW8D8U3_9BURK|nr:copper-binding protein [Variovorax boronicumulans]MDP9897068.1 Cu/Ag efflux protein CusF [Variovorax boronicumulans]MDQ0057109.1 Cu/Ag efflux protein CusF [Variovorax boronicumulans]